MQCCNNLFYRAKLCNLVVARQFVRISDFSLKLITDVKLILNAEVEGFEQPTLCL